VLSQDVARQYLSWEISYLDIGQARARLVGVGNERYLKPPCLSNLLFADIATAQELLRQVGSLSHIDLIVRPEDKAAIAAMLPTGVKLETAEAQKNAVQQMTAAFELNLLL